jgi:sodium transport system permease protein
VTEGTPHDGKVPGPGTALLLLLSVALLFVSGGVALQLLLGEVGLVLAQILLLLLPVWLLVRFGGFDARRTLSLRRPPPGSVTGGMLFLFGGLQVAIVLAWLQSLVMPVPVEYLETLSELLRADSATRFIWLVFLAAFVPAIAEETLFRGVVLSSLRTRLPTAAAVVITGTVFGLFHLTPETAFRFLPTAWLGILLSWVVVLSGSLPLAMLLHFLNNAAVLAVSTIPVAAERMNAVEDQPPPVLFGLTGALLLVWGFRKLRGAGPALERGESPASHGDQGLQP